MNPIFSRNPEKALAVARALGAVQGPENPPEERLRTFLSLHTRLAAVVQLVQSDDYYTDSRLVAYAGPRVGPVIAFVTLHAHPGARGPEGRFHPDSYVVWSGFAITYKVNGKRARRARREKALEAVAHHLYGLEVWRSRPLDSRTLHPATAVLTSDMSGRVHKDLAAAGITLRALAEAADRYVRQRGWGPQASPQPRPQARGKQARKVKVEEGTK